MEVLGKWIFEIMQESNHISRLPKVKTCYFNRYSILVAYF